MSEYVNNTGDEAESEVEYDALPTPHAWLPVLVGIVACSSLFVVTVMMMMKHIDDRPFDLVQLSEETAQSIKIFLRDHQVYPDQVIEADQRKITAPKAHYLQYGFTVYLAPGVEAAIMERQLSKKMARSGLDVQEHMEASDLPGLSINVSDFTLATINFIEARKSTFSPAPSAAVSLNRTENTARFILPTMNRKALPVNAHAALVSPVGVKDASKGWRPPTPQSKAVSSIKAPEEVDADTQLAKKTDTVKPKNMASDMKSVKKARLVIIVDDGGWEQSISESILALNPKLTLSILPNTPVGTETAEMGHKKGFEIMLHMPMENNNGKWPHKGQLNINMSEEEIKTLTKDALKQIPHVTGVNNHTGSKFTTDAKAMSLFMDSIKDEELFFIDSKTSAKTTAYGIAKAFGIPSAERDLFLDNKMETNEAQAAEIRKRFEQVIELALEEGDAIAICHFRPTTAKVLAEILPTLETRGIELVHASELVK